MNIKVILQLCKTGHLNSKNSDLPHLMRHLSLLHLLKYLKNRIDPVLSTGNQLAVIFCTIAITLFMLIASSSAVASEINKKLELKPNFSHLLTFDEKIVRYRIGDEAAFNVEILPDIMNSRNEMLIKPLKETKTNFLVWTENHIYNFDVNARQKDEETEFLKFNGDKKPVSPKKQALKPITVGKYKVDLPPEPPEQSIGKSSTRDFEIDLPPKLN